MANKARPKKVVERFEAEVSKFHPSGDPFISIEPTKFQPGDRVEVTVKLLKRKA